MKWIAIAGSWRETAPTIEADVRAVVREIFEGGDGVVTGGALGVDYIATDEYLKLDPTAARLKIFLPSTLENYFTHCRSRKQNPDALIAQLECVKEANPQAIIEGEGGTLFDKSVFFNKISSIVKAADELYAFQINMSEGTQDTIDKAKNKGIPLHIHTYTV